MKIIIIGAGIGGLATSIRLRVAGHEVAIFEAASQPGGKLSEIRADGFRWDAGPSLFTMPQLVTELFELAGRRPEDFFEYEALPIITRYFYEDGTLINAFHDPEAFIQELLLKTDEKETNIRSLLAKSAELYEITNHVFLERSLHKLSTYLRKETLRSALQVHKLDAFRSMHASNTKRFADPRVVQLFDRYATYNGSDPYQAPATLNIIPHLEHSMGAFFPKGGMYAITQALFGLAQDLGVDFHFETPVQRITVDNGRVSGIVVDGEQIPADAVVSNADIVPTYRKLLPTQKAPEMVLSQPRSSSALIFYWGMNKAFPQLDTHNIFFSDNYEEEFRQIWKVKSLSSDPTVYVFVSSKVEPTDAPSGCENWFVMINTPANTGQDWESLIAEAREHILQKLDRNLGEDVQSHIISQSILDPRSIESRTSSHQGALYGSSSNNPMAAFLRHPNFSRKLSGLYFCGGSVHPGGGIPLCLLSARIATDCMEEDFAKS
ncbi:MAG: phytoene desaturase family protein [Bacteroidia bacterium]|nr:phytoene desaturase family protein [Bacteroidia bacterium]